MKPIVAAANQRINEIKGSRKQHPGGLRGAVTVGG
jgi:hypothetical protein